MVKRTNRIHNLNKMILEYKREQEKFEVIEKEIFNQQKEIEDLRLLILSTNFMSQNSSSNQNSSASVSSLENLSIKKINKGFKDRLNSTKESTPKIIDKKFNPNEQLDKELIKGKIKEKIGRKLKDEKINPQTNQSVNQSTQLKSVINEQSNQNEKFIQQISRTNQFNKPKGLQTISKNVLNQKNNKYLNDKLITKSNDKSIIEKESKNGSLVTNNLIENEKGEINTESTISMPNELLNKINKLKATGNIKFDNQENPKELGISKISKGINKKTRFTKSNLIKSTKLATSNRTLQRL